MQHWITAFAIACLATLPALAAEEVKVVPCEEAGAGLTTLVIPVRKNVRSFYSGQVNVFNFDTDGEPACCSSGIAITYPVTSPEDPAYSRCVAIHGFLGIDIRKAKSAYIPAKGLVLVVPTVDYDPSGAHKPGKPLVVTISLDDGGKVTARR
jgi:hypothetical protein